MSNGLTLENVIAKFEKVNLHFQEFYTEAKAFVSAKYAVLKDQDRQINLICTLIFASIIFYHTPLFFIPLSFIGVVLSKNRESFSTSIQKINFLWETKTVQTVIAFASCMILYRNFWNIAALGLGFFIAYEKPQPQPEDVAPPAAGG